MTVRAPAGTIDPLPAMLARTSFLLLAWGALVAACGGGSPSVKGDGGSDTTGASGTCTVSDVAAVLSPKITTVGIVTFATSAAAPTTAFIEFGLTTAYGMKAPVDLKTTDHRTLLLGMKPASTYHYRITIVEAAGGCGSGDQTIATGPRRNGLPQVTVKTNAPDKLSPGFIVTGEYPDAQSGAYILDADGEAVWTYNIDDDISGAVMSYDGRFMWINGVNCCDQHGPSNVHRVSMDGITDENLSGQFPGQNHQLAVLPDESVVFYGYNPDVGCDDIMIRDPSGTTKTIVNSGKAQGVTDGCHLNAIQYSKKDDTFVFSDLDHSSYTKITRAGQTVWVLNGPGSTFGQNLWTKNHGLDILDVDRLVIFINGGDWTPSQAIEWKLDLTAKTATKVWSYVPADDIHIEALGDVQRLPNGNTLVAFSTAGLLHEVAPDGTLVQTLTWGLGAGFGYAQKRASLYGPPPR